MNATIEPRRIDKPEPGTFRLRLVRGGPFVAATILHRMGFWSAEINGQPCGGAHPDPAFAEGVERVWTGGVPIGPAEHDALLRFPPPSPSLPIDIGGMAPITFEEPIMSANANVVPLRRDTPTLDLAAALEPKALGAWIEARLVIHTERADALLTANKRFQAATAAGIANDDVAGKATDFVRQIKDAISETDAERVRIKAPVLAAQRAIDGAAKAITDPLLAASIEGERRVTVFLTEKDRALRAAALAEATRAREAAAALLDRAVAANDPDTIEHAIGQAGEAELEQHTAAAIVHAPTADLTRVRTLLGGTSSLRDNWVYDVANIDEVPAHFLMVNDAAVKAAIKGGNRNIPGLNIRNQPKVGIR